MWIYNAKRRSLMGSRRHSRRKGLKMKLQIRIKMHGVIRALAVPISAGLFIIFIGTSGPVQAAEITVYKSPWCGCCTGWVQHMKANGHTVITKNLENLDAIKTMLNVPEPLQSCHTATVGSYVIEGHVPASDVQRLLTERPKITGLAAPGMPVGSPGMEGGAPEPYDVIAFRPDGTKVFAKH